MNIPKINVPKVDLKAAKNTISNVAQSGFKHVKGMPKAARTLAHDTLDVATLVPKEAATLVGLGAVGLAAAIGIGKAVKAGVHHITHKN